MNSDSKKPSTVQRISLKDIYTHQSGQTPYGGLPPHQRHSDTSRQAAEAQLPHLGRLQRAYLTYLDFCGKHGATDHEAAQYLNHPLSSINARRNELRQLGLVRGSGRRRMSPYGMMATVWVKS